MTTRSEVIFRSLSIPCSRCEAPALVPCKHREYADGDIDVAETSLCFDRPLLCGFPPPDRIVGAMLPGANDRDRDIVASATPNARRRARHRPVDLRSVIPRRHPTPAVRGFREILTPRNHCVLHPIFDVT